MPTIEKALVIHETVTRSVTPAPAGEPQPRVETSAAAMADTDAPSLSIRAQYSGKVP